MRIMNVLSPAAFRSYPEMYCQLHCKDLALKLRRAPCYQERRVVLIIYCEVWNINIKTTIQIL